MPRAARTRSVDGARGTPQRLGARLLATLALAAGGACGDSAAPRVPPRNVLLVSIDTLRADHVGCYGYERDTTPRLDRFAERATRYANAIAPAPWTLPSHAAMLTGRHPHEIGVTTRQSRLPAEVVTLAERLSREGFQTAAFVDSGPNGFVGRGRGFDRGFDAFRHAPHEPHWVYQYDMALTARAAERWLRARDPARPFFLFLHTKSVHTVGAARNLDGDPAAPYHSPAAYRLRFLDGGKLRFRWIDDRTGEGGVRYLLDLNKRLERGTVAPEDFPARQLEELIGLYDGGIAYTDEHVGEVLDTLDRLGLTDETLVIVTADHGEGFLEHGEFFHEQLYGTQLRVPLLVQDPGEEQHGEVVDSPVSLVDLPPTILARLGLEPEHTMTGTPLPRPGERSAPERTIFSTTIAGHGEEACTSGAIHAGPWKLVYHRASCDEPIEVELYRFVDDPLDARALDGLDGERTGLMERLEAWLRTGGAASHDLELDAETLEELRALGYGG